MIADAVLNYLVGCASFGFATIFTIKLRDDLTVPTSAALAPPLSLLALALPETERGLLLLAPLFALLVLVLARRVLLEVVQHLLLLTAIYVVIELAVGPDAADSPRVLALSLLLTCAYSVSAFVLHVPRRRHQSESRHDLTVWWLLQGVLLCACGVTVLMLERMGWPAFLAMAAVLALTKREFDAFGKSRIAYDQTVRALDRLSERAERERLTR